MKQAYIAISFSQYQTMQAELEAIRAVLKAVQIEPFVFVEHYHFALDEAKTMMQTARKHLDESDVLIAELSHKAIGVGVEVGYMSAQDKPILYLRREGAEYSSTVGGLATYEIVYRDIADLRGQLGEVFGEMGI